MKNWKPIAALATTAAVAIAAQPASAGGHFRAADDGFFINAPVTHVDPIVRYVNVQTPQEVCWNQNVREPVRRQRNAAPTVIGGIIGGVLGSQVTRHRGRSSRNAATAAGALVGALVGNDYGRRTAAPPRTYVTTQRVCEVNYVTHTEERIDGYRVSYRYRGRHFVTQTATHPGSTIRVRVQVEPVAYNGPRGRRHG